MELSEYPKVAILILNWNGKEDTLECLSSLQKVEYPSLRMYVVDNGSKDESLKVLRRSFPPSGRLTYIGLNENRGYAGGNNIGLERALKDGADYVLILNNDTLVEPDFLDILVRIARENPDAGVLGPKVLCYPDKHLLYSGGEHYSLWFNRRTVNIGEADRKGERGPKKVDYAVGCAMFVTRPFVERVGMLDETFFAYFEEVDWCFRGRRAGFDILYVPEAVVYHKGGVSTGGTFSPIASYYRTRNWIYFMRKHAAFYHWFTFVPLFSYVFARRFLKAMVRWDVPVMRSLNHAVLWNIKNRESDSFQR